MAPRFPVPGNRSRSRRDVIGGMVGLAASLPVLGSPPAFAQAVPALPNIIPPGTRLVVADQNEALQTLIQASGEQAKLSSTVTYANFLGGPAILEAFRAGALDLATVGNTPPIQAHAAGERIPIVAARTSSETDYFLAVRPGLKIDSLEELRGKSIAYGEGTGRQPFVLNALKLAGLTRKDVKLVPLRAADFPDAVRSGQVDVAALNEPHYSRYLADFADRGASGLPKAQNDRLPKSLTYLYASQKALDDPAKAAAIREFVLAWISASRWSQQQPGAWVDAYYVRRQRLKPEDARRIVESEGHFEFPSLSSLIPVQQALIDVIHDAGDLPRRLDARAEFDLRFDAVIATATH
ncbi:MAG: PhnD/SsuA/transferrin family substrate-binding protein [Novosphingobium sp.]|uniref:PhnD/SsuA/transferrin family substrate-binding protein n=1 Tax=Novosphingobium sp. TaxID=1874826 RepID=UPI0022CB291E|nr:PhnD/SsuA/transferrin family substrate-binding protein [Novosphingobium sp.]MCZ8035963.1 PhnD/SsuA/transferrin family substrate-binding protein [Novosphingobium sp.]